ncbi:MAG TPA: hypothetical protein VN905_03430 [Candidatus Binatia bacterium]|nr:hypothetical protein [Candidatus Binatia bacterium]
MFKQLLILFACLWVTGGIAIADPTTTAKLAPADEYFGRLKMSVLGIQNVVKDMRLRVQADPGKTESIFGALAMVENSIHDWESKYPEDTWIAKDLLALEITYLAAAGEKARSVAVRIEAWLHHDYPGSPYAAQARDELAKADATTAPFQTSASPQR